MKVSIPRAWTVGKSISFDPEAGARAEAAVAALAAQISAGLGGNIIHRNLQQLQVGDDHPQYTGNAFPETITGQWNFSTVPFIQGDTLAEYIEDVVGGSFFDFLQDTTSVVWTYHETANELEANVPPEFVQDVVGAMLVDTTSIDLAYNDGAGTFTASIIDEYVQDLIGALFVDSTSIDFTYSDSTPSMTATVITANPSGLIGMTAVNGTAATPLRSDGRHAIDPAIAPTWTGTHTFTGGTGFIVAGTSPYWSLRETDQSADEQDWAHFVVAKTYFIGAVDSSGTIFRAVMSASRGTGAALTAINLGNANDNAPIRINGDNQELQIGAGQDLRIYHDGTNSFIENDTGNLVLKVNGELDLEEVTTSTGANVPTIGTNKPGSAVSLTPSTWLTLVVNGTTYFLPLWQ